jgi:predicted AlkP superfamily phosphohydrolase/phosphomutase
MQKLILGFDAFDPGRFERLSSEGKLPHLNRYVEDGGYARLEVTAPPQTEVSWTSIATGVNPGGHGIFDFVHRNPKTYSPYVSLLPTESKLFGTQFVPPFEATTIFEEVAQQGYPSTVLWWPATFPARPASLVRTIPGLGTPDIQGRLGVGTFLSANPDLAQGKTKTSFERLERDGNRRYTSLLKGPASTKLLGSVKQTSVELKVEPLDDESARLAIGGHTLELTRGEWSPILELSFRVNLLVSVQAITRIILTQVRPDVALYVLPLQIHPLHSIWRYGTPNSFIKQTWQECGPFLTLGWPQDTTGLEEQCITDRQFLDLCESIFRGREGVLMHHLQNFQEGILALVFDSLDRIQHMFWHTRPDIVDAWYVKLDALVGKVEQRLKELGKDEVDTFILSDHGFTNFDRKVHLNRWLLDQGYLALKDEDEKASQSLENVDWSQSKAYAVGLNSLYLNLARREGEGIVQADERETEIQKLCNELERWRGPDDQAVIQRAWPRREVIAGPFTERGPDIIVGYSPGYRASQKTGMGKWSNTILEPNQDHWGSDHCVASQAVPGVLFSSQSLDQYPHPSYRDIPPLVIGKELDQSDTAPPRFSQEDQDIVEKRLESLGYL